MGVAAVALGVCCGLPALVSAGVVAGLAVWLVGGGVLAAAIVAVATVMIVRARRRRACAVDGAAGAGP